MKSLHIIIGILMVFVLGSAATAQDILPAPRAENPPVIVPTVTNDNMLNAYSLYLNAALEFHGVEAATIEGSEPQHSCATGGAATGSHSIWLATHTQAGKITLDTAGSAFQTASGVSSNTVLSLYRAVGDISTLSSASLQLVACASNGSGAAKLNKQAIPIGLYFIQISLESGETALSGSKVALKATIKPKELVKGDNINDPRPMTVPLSKSLYTLMLATAALDEPFDPLLPTGSVTTQIGRSLWYQFELKQALPLAIISSTTLVSLFKQEPNGTLTSVPFSFQMNFADESDMLAAGKYLLRIALPAHQLPPQYLPYLAGSNSHLIILPALVRNSSFGVNEGTPSATGSLESWTLKKGTPTGEAYADELVCGFEDEQCGFKLMSSGANEKTKLVTKSKLPPTRLRKGEAILLFYMGESFGNGETLIEITLQNAQGEKMTLSHIGYPSPLTINTNVLVMPRPFTPVKATVTVSLLSKTAGDGVIIDTLYISPYRTYEPAR